MYIAFGAQRDQIILAEKRWSRTDKAPVALIHAEQLGQLDHTAPAREGGDSR
jgi:hypothetical protein